LRYRHGQHAARSTDEYVFHQLLPYLGNKRYLLDLIGDALDATGVDPARASAVVEVVEVCVGSLDRIVADEGGHGPLMNAALLHLRLGGELRAAVDGDRLSLEFWWPAAR